MGTEAAKPAAVEETSLHDDIAAAFKEQDAEPVVKEEGQPRGEDGKFQAKPGEKAEDAAARLEPTDKPAEGAPKPAEGAPPAAQPTGEQKPADPLLTQDKAPQGWTPAIREKWGTIPEDIRKEIIRREEAVVAGVRQLQERYTPYENFANSLSPYIGEASRAGIDPAGYIGNVMASERILRTADVPTRFQEILRIAEQYGVPLRDIINRSVGEEVIKSQPAPQGGGALPPAVQQELAQMRQRVENFENTNVQNQIAAFAVGKEFFGDVKEHMANLFESNMVNTLQEAYDMACWAVPAVREVMLSRQGQSKQQDELKNKQQQASAASPKPASGGVIVKDEEDVDDLSAVVRSAYTASANGRV